MVRQYKIHLDLDGVEDKVWDVTNGKLRFYTPSDLGIEVGNNMWGTGGIGVMGERAINQPVLEFKLETFGNNLRENYEIFNEFINDILSKKFVTLEYSTEWFQVFADIALSKQTKTEGYGNNGTFSETITFDIITKWYTYENLTFSTLQNGEIVDGKSKIYGGKLPGYRYIQNVAYTYYGETNIERLSRWTIDKPFFSFVARLIPANVIDGTKQIGLSFLDRNLNEYTAMLFTLETKPDFITINTDVNDEYYQATTGTTTINAFPALDFQRYRTRLFQPGQMTMQNLSMVEIKVKRKVDFV
ncbi:phage distal tail protein domain-containing protein [Lactococcus ileimucosae]|uniref:phage distal tail protein domain-containing protein n=1 Tax=Lactococcus ileimucosae TaxID=2941329 RepID=UPI003515F652